MSDRPNEREVKEIDYLIEILREVDTLFIKLGEAEKQIHKVWSVERKLYKKYGEEFERRLYNKRYPRK